MDAFVLKISFAYAIIARMYRLYKKSKQPDQVEVYLPEGIKFLLTWVFIYLFTILFGATMDAIGIIFNKIF
jgi:hypothetical protein